MVVWSIFEESVPMSTYLVAYTVNDFAYKESRVEESNVIFRTWSRPDDIELCCYAAKMGPKILKYYERLFGKFPLAKIDQIVIPDLSKSAMENWGLITYRPNTLYVTPNLTSHLSQLSTIRTISHELAHQWFGNMVTMKWWTDLWLNEGFATYISTLAVEHVHPEFEAYITDSFNFLVSVFERDAKMNSHPLSQPIQNTSDIRHHFDTISYRKGSSVLRMLHMLVGYEEFFEPVRIYLETHRYGNAEQDDLWAAFTQTAYKYNRLHSRYNLKKIMDSWTLQSGYPLVKVTRNYETDSIVVTQMRFLEDITLSKEAEGFAKCWWIPLSFTTGKEMDFTNTTPKAWLECDETGKSVPLTLTDVIGNDTWIIFNIQLSGIYRIMYDPKSWQQIGETLKGDQLKKVHVLNRGQIINDVLSLALAGYHSYDVAFDVLEYLYNEWEYLPWGLAFRGLNEINSLLESYPQTYDLFKEFISYIIEPLYQYMGGLTDSVSGSLMPFQIRLKYRAIQWACRADLKYCVEKAQNYFQKLKLAANPLEENRIPDDFRETVYCTAIRHGNERDFQYVWQLYEKYRLQIFVEALKCSRNETLIHDHLNLIFDGTRNISEYVARNTFIELANGEVGSHIAREYVYKHADRLCKVFGTSSLVAPLTSRIYTSNELAKLKEFLHSNKECGKNFTKIPQSVLEKMNLNIRWIERNLEDITTTLKKRAIMQENLNSSM